MNGATVILAVAAYCAGAVAFSKAVLAFSSYLNAQAGWFQSISKSSQGHAGDDSGVAQGTEGKEG